MTNKPDIPDISQQFEQMEVMLENNAKVMSTYYKELLKQGISDDFAQKLVMDLHHSLWSSLRRGSPPETE